MRPVKLAIRDALAADGAVSELVPSSQIFAVERATVPTLPSIELIGISSERVDTGPMVRHTLAVEVTISNATEDAADVGLAAIVRAVRVRLSESETSVNPIALPTREGLAVVLGDTRWSVSASGASVSVSVEVSE